MWYRHEQSLLILQQWWNSSLDSYEDNPLQRKFRLKWPWEQDRQMAIFHQPALQKHIQIMSHPHQSTMPRRIAEDDWCLSHLPGRGCFFAHHCANKSSKKRMMQLYKLSSEGDTM